MFLYSYQLHREGLILKVGEQFAEIAPLPGFSRETLDEAREDAWAWIRFRKKPETASVRWAVECLNRPLQSVSLPLSALGLKKGFPTVKLKLGHRSLIESIDLVKQHHAQVRLRLDCNRAWSLADALEFVSHFKPDDFEYLEEPVKTFEELIAFSRLTHFPIAIDESIRMDWAQIPSLKAIVVKPMIVGTIPFVPPCYQLILSSSYESGLGLVHIANRASPLYPVGLDTYQADGLLVQPIQTENGRFIWHASQLLLDEKKLCPL